jgi:ribosomal protein S18 acetylase RimI-like enzyme
MEIIYQLTDSHIEELHGLYLKEWWSSSRSLEETKRGVLGSQICIGIIDDNQSLIGFTRVLTDFIFKAMIFDVIISEPYRKMGIGEQLISAIKNHPDLKAVKHVELYCRPELVPFYQRLGFSTDVVGMSLMRLLNN